MQQGRKIRVKRVFSIDFKKLLVQEYEKGKLSVPELAELHDIGPAVIYRWIYRYSTYQKRNIKIVEMSESSTHKIKELQKRIQDLERVVGQKQLQIDFLEKMMEIAKAEYGIDIKKNSDAPPSNTSTTKGK